MTEKYEITLTFNKKQKADQWLGWWLDGGGEQECGVYTDPELSEDWTKNKYPLKLFLEFELN